jgi:hypothetical protein
MGNNESNHYEPVPMIPIVHEKKKEEEDITSEIEKRIWSAEKMREHYKEKDIVFERVLSAYRQTHQRDWLLAFATLITEQACKKAKQRGPNPVQYVVQLHRWDIARVLVDFPTIFPIENCKGHDNASWINDDCRCLGCRVACALFNDCVKIVGAVFIEKGYVEVIFRSDVINLEIRF